MIWMLYLFTVVICWRHLLKTTLEVSVFCLFLCSSEQPEKCVSGASSQLAAAEQVTWRSSRESVVFHVDPCSPDSDIWRICSVCSSPVPDVSVHIRHLLTCLLVLFLSCHSVWLHPLLLPHQMLPPFPLEAKGIGPVLPSTLVLVFF